MKQGLFQLVEGGELALVDGFEALGFWFKSVDSFYQFRLSRNSDRDWNGKIHKRFDWQLGLRRARGVFPYLLFE